jgi:hypothetical protein
MVHPDVVDSGRRVVLEADPWEFHTGKDAHARDCRRYTLLVVHGWTVLRFTWRQVMHDADIVRWCLVSLLEGTPPRGERRLRRRIPGGLVGVCLVFGTKGVAPNRFHAGFPRRVGDHG